MSTYLFKSTKHGYEVSITWEKITSSMCTTEEGDIFKENIYLILKKKI